MDAVLFKVPEKGATGFHIHAACDTVGTSAEIVARNMSSAYAQLAAEGKIEIVSAEAADIGMKVTVYGIDDSGNRVSEDMFTNGTGVVTSSTTFRYLENARMDKEAAGAITIRAVDDTFVMEIAIGSLNTQIAQHFNGEYKGYITYFAATLEDLVENANVELRWYPDDADCLDSGDGFEVLDRLPLYATGETGNPAPRVYAQGIELPAGGWLSAFATGETGSANVSVTIQGFNKK